jgi:DNA-binding transcriptional LysR family regulator
MKLTLHQLRTFSAIARFGNLNQASEELCLSKGALSQTLQQLEQQLATELFDRVQRRLKLNSQGRLLLPLAEEMLSRAQEIEQLFGSYEHQPEVLNIGASQTIGNYMLPTLLASQPTLCQAKIQIANTQTLCQQLLRFELDMALVEGQNTHAELQATPWQQDEMILIAAPNHPLLDQGNVSLADLDDQPWVLREAYSGSREQFERHIRPALTNVNQVMEFSSLESIMLAVENGLGLSFISLIAAQARLELGRIARLPYPNHFYRQLSIVQHRHKYASKGMKTLTEHFLNAT